MYLSIGVFFILAICYWMIWSKLCDIEQKQFRMHDEMSLYLKSLEEQIDITQNMIERINQNR